MATIQNVRDKIRAAIAEGDYKRALSLVQFIRRYYPDDYETAALLGQIHLEKGRYQEAREAFEVVIEADPENVLTRWALATITEEQGDLDGALEQLERAFNIESTNRGLAEEITRLHSRLSHTRPADPGAWEHAMGRQLLLMKKYDEAVSQLESALSMTSAEEVAVGLAHALWLARRPLQAEQAANRILFNHISCLKALAIAAAAAFSRGEEEAAPLLLRTAALNPGNPMAARIFQEGGLLFPGIGMEVDIPEGESREPAMPTGNAIGSPAATRHAEALGQPGIRGARDRSWSQDGRGAIGLEEEPWAKPRPGMRSEGSGWLSRRLAASLGKPAEGLEGETNGEPAGPAVEEAAPAVEEIEALVSALAEEGTAPSVPLAGEEPHSGPLAGVIGEREFREEGRISLPQPEPQGDWPKEKIWKAPLTDRQGDVALHITFARSYESRGHLALAIDEYRTALRLDDTTAPAIQEAALGLAEANPESMQARWLVGDALATGGQFRQAVEQYLMVLKGRREAPTGGEPHP